MGKDKAFPDLSSWQPRDASESLSAIFAKECAVVESGLLAALKHEKTIAVDNFDSGMPFEALVRKELKRTLPKRYSITTGQVLDRDGKTAGKCDVVVFDERWFSPLRKSEADASGNSLLPVEGVYAVGEIKQTLSIDTLDQALEKLVKCHRLQRARTEADRIVENRKGNRDATGHFNPLYSFIFAGGLAPGTSFEQVIDRFFEVSKGLKRSEVIRSLCVLGQGVSTWAYRPPSPETDVRIAQFMQGDLTQPIFPVYWPESYRGALELFSQLLQQTLFHVILAPEDLYFKYGVDNNGVKVPSDPSIALDVSKE